MNRRSIPLMLVALVTLATTIMVPSRAQNAKRDNTPIVPVIPGQDHSNPQRVFLEHADRLLSHPYASYQILTGDVCFRKGGMYMYCDSAHFSDATGNFEAFGNVRMEQGDTLFIYADQLAYEDSLKLAVLYADPGKNVRLINRDVTLETPIFNYDMGIDLGYYENVGGKLFDSLNTLTSTDGEYNPTTKEAIFTYNVHLTSRNRNDSDTLEINTENLYYNTLTHIARMDDESRVANADGVIFTSNGEYNTESTFAQLFNRSTVVSTTGSSRGTTLTADTIYYDRTKLWGEAFGDMILTDTINQMILEGDYGYFDQNIDSAFVTGRARVIQYKKLLPNRDFNPDMLDTIFVNGAATPSTETIYLHGDTIRAFRRIKMLYDTIRNSVAGNDMTVNNDKIDIIVRNDTIYNNDEIADNDSIGMIVNSEAIDFTVNERPDTVRYIVAAPHVKFYRRDMQGLCDSLTYVSADSMAYMDYSPIVWSENRQIFGDEIRIHFKEKVTENADSTTSSTMALDNAYIPSGGFMAEFLEDGYYNQLSGKEMFALFADGALSHIDVSGNVLAITFPEENDSTINKVVNLESSFLAADFKDNALEKMKMWSETSGTVTPLYLAKKSLFYLPAFSWYEEHRPITCDHIFVFSEDLQHLFDAARGRERKPKETAVQIIEEMPLTEESLPTDTDNDENSNDNSASGDRPDEVS